MGGDREGLLRSGEVLGRARVGVTPIPILATHDALEGGLHGHGSIQKELWGVNPQIVPGHSGESLDVELGTEGWIEIHLDASDPRGLEDKDIGSSRIPELVGHPVHKDLITSLDVSMDDCFSGFIDTTRAHAKIACHHITRGKDGEFSLRGNDFCKGEEIELGMLIESQHLLFGGGLEIKVGASKTDEVHCAGDGTWERILRRMARHAVERGLHRPRGDLEGLQEISLESNGERYRDDDGFDIFRPDRMWSGRDDGREAYFEITGHRSDLLLLLSGDRPIQAPNEFLQLGNLPLFQEVTMLMKGLGGSLGEESGILDVSGGKESHG